MDAVCVTEVFSAQISSSGNKEGFMVKVWLHLTLCIETCRKSIADRGTAQMEGWRLTGAFVCSGGHPFALNHAEFSIAVLALEGEATQNQLLPDSGS